MALTEIPDRAGGDAPAAPPSHPAGLKRWAPWFVLVVIALVALALGSHQHSTASLDGETSHIAGLVRCPVCDGETAAQSQSPVSVQIRATIRQDLQKGMTENQILAQLVRSYGAGILEKPEAKGLGLIVYVVPVVAVVLGGAAVVLLVGRWRGRRAEGLAEPVDVEPPDGAEEADRPATSGNLAARPRVRRRWVVAGAGVALVAAGASWAVVASSSTRLTGQTITGSGTGALTPAQVRADLQAATTDSGRGDDLAAVKEYQKVLASDPNQVEALSGEGWLLAQTQQPALLQQGLQLLQRAEEAQPDYAPAHVYRGIALLSEDDYSDSIPELQWYLAHNPDPQLAPKVQSALAQARAGAAAG